MAQQAVGFPLVLVRSAVRSAATQSDALLQVAADAVGRGVEATSRRGDVGCSSIRIVSSALALCRRYFGLYTFHAVILVNLEFFFTNGRAQTLVVSARILVATIALGVVNVLDGQVWITDQFVHIVVCITASGTLTDAQALLQNRDQESVSLLDLEVWESNGPG